MGGECSEWALRSHNLIAIPFIVTTAARCRDSIEVWQARRAGRPPVWDGISWYSFHTGINIALMPVIFFFSGLYYTDVWSTLVVLQAYKHHLKRLGPQKPSLYDDLWTIIWGVTALFMRQTNVFWVVVYMGGVEAVHALRSVKPGAQEFLTTVHDPPLHKSGPEGKFLIP